MTRPINKRFDQLTEALQHPNFGRPSGKGNEVGFHIFDYDPKDEWLVRDHVQWIKDRFSLPVKEFDLWEVTIDILKSKGFLEKSFEIEKRDGSERVYAAIKSTLRLATKEDLIRKYVRDHIQPDDIVFITGVGRVYPLVRAHTVLNNLQGVLEKNTLVMFYPGTYNGGTLQLFNTLLDDNYYRAFQIVER
ncbi:hypothetical protein HNR44_003048 [Geomicrobium halophilum]|uniref:DUF1788 domain-containing protein n=1 Tax=Geomicrobium halophilum TaxID=549000 RepID=A0A841PTF3_9BACL|nr:DUF1788 domain-containing protein [Geomicrobium halophilum]MBB6451054.1 hypothetical protein [Geomicrobium halophilum]